MKSRQGPEIQLAFLALFFLLGAFIGYLYAGYCSSQSNLLLEEYLDGYCLLFEDQTQPVAPLTASLQLYYGNLLLVFICGFAVVGAVLIPAVSAAFGFSCMFAIACFAQVYGRYGIVLALSALGIRLLFTLPCFLWVGSHGWFEALARLPGHKGKRCAQTSGKGLYFYRLAVCCVLLMIGISFERYVTPYLFHFALKGLSVWLSG